MTTSTISNEQVRAAQSCLDEDTLSALVEGKLTETELGQAEGHVDQCATCRLLLAELLEPERRPTQELRRGDRVRRYVILELLGAGGMGLVYAAYDPELDRRVALKRLPRLQHTSATEGRLLREARLLGQLSHKNVLRIHDAGIDDDQFFFAMDLMDGKTLRAWLFERPRTWREILNVFEKAGRGLAAAHERGVLHRDFKPDNVLCGKDGSVVVADFGLARLLSDPAEAPEQTADSTEVPAMASPITDRGVVPGTPGYVAPELYAGEVATARSDQWSFCIALYEGLYGVRPFVGQNLVELRAAVLHGTIRLPPGPGGDQESERVPRWLLPILRRGLSRDPQARFASMDALLAALAAGPPGRRRLRLVIGFLLLAALLGIGLRGLLRWPLVTCLAAGRQSSRGFGDVADNTLQRYAAAWSLQWRDACLSTHLWRAKAERTGAAQAACLELAQAEARAIEKNLRVQQGPLSSGVLRDLRRCQRAAMVRGWPERGANGVGLRTQLAQARAHLAKAEPHLAISAATQALDTARRQSREAAQAEALLLRGTARRLIDATGSEADLKEALWSAQAAQHDAAAAEALVALVESGGARADRGVMARHLVQYARAAIERLGGDAQLESRLAAAAAR